MQIISSNRIKSLAYVARRGRAVPTNTTIGGRDEVANTWKYEGFGPWFRLHGAEHYLRSTTRTRRRRPDDPSCSRARRDLLRHGGGLRALHQRATGRRRPCP